MKIQAFQGRYRFLSNFWLTPTRWRAMTFPSVEHAYQAEKFFVEGSKVSQTILLCLSYVDSPGNAKRLAAKLAVLGFERKDWMKVNVQTMQKLLRIKFKDPLLAQILLDTEDAELIEGNTWGDKFWGVCDGEGENMLGKLIMEVRDELRNRKTR